jgi:hypothetical protein
LASETQGARVASWYLLAMGGPWGARYSALAAAFACFLLAARADAGTAGAVSSYRAPAECPDEAAWRTRLQAPDGAERASVFGRLEVEIERLGGGVRPPYEGRLRQLDDDTTGQGRQVRGATCREVFEALALIARLGLARMSADPDASPAKHAKRDPAPPAGASSWALSEREELELARDPLPGSAEPRRRSGRVRLGGAALALWGGAARATTAVDVGLAIAARWESLRLQPFVLAGVYGGRERFGVSGTAAGARLERLVLHVVACPLRFPRSAALGVRPCVDLDAGMLRGSGVSVEGARGHAAPWLSTGVQLRAEWSPWGPLELSAMVGGVVALSRPRFYFVPDTTAFQAEAAALRAGASAGVSF